MDFVTITYNDSLENNLLKLQAMSMIYVDANLINNIYIVYNDNEEFDLNDTIKYYPENIRHKIKLFHNAYIDTSFINKKSSWTNQQILKLLVAKIIKTDHYLILDCKNHFIRNITYNDYFDKNGKPYLFIDGSGYMTRYYNCLAYYNITCPFNNIKKVLTTTPYLMNTNDVIEMINYIENKESKSFYDFFSENSSKYTEFFLYSTFLIFKNKINNYALTITNTNCIMSSGPNVEWNSYVNRCVPIINNSSIKIFGLHKKAISLLDETYKQQLIEFYSNFYDKNICHFINNTLFQ
jgi:hypothetical protein